MARKPTIEHRKRVNLALAGHDGADWVLTVDGRAETLFDEPSPCELQDYLTPKERITRDIRRAAVRIFSGEEERPFEAIALKIGCTRAAISKEYRRILVALGDSQTYLRAAARRKMALSAQSGWHKSAAHGRPASRLRHERNSLWSHGRKRTFTSAS